MNKTLFSLAFINSLWEQNKDIFDAYIPLFCTCISQKWDKTSAIDKMKVKEWMDDVYGLTNLTYGAADSILSKMVSKGILKRESGSYKVFGGEVEKHIKKPAFDFEKEIDNLAVRIETYAKAKFELTLEKGKVIAGIMSFLDGYADDMILKKDKLFSESLKNVKESTKVKYILSRYVLDNNDEVDLLRKLAQGYEITSIISFNNLENLVGNMANVIIALDAPIIFNLLQLNGEAAYKMTKELMDILRKNRVNFVVFTQNESEVISTISDARDRLKSKCYTLQFSSRLLKTAVREKYTPEYLDLKLNELDDLYHKYDITVENAPDFPVDYREIDLERLKEQIVGIYTNNGVKKLPKNLETTIDIDVDSVSYIFRLRGTKLAANLKQCKALLVTTNKALAFASNNKEISELHHIIPSCVTDVFLSTALWRNFPQECKDLNLYALMNECYSNIELDDSLIQRFYDDLELQHKNGIITEKTYVMVSSSHLIASMLENKTYNDRELYTDMTASEIIQDIENEYKKDLIEEQKRHKRDNAKNRVDRHIDDVNVGRISRWIAVVSYWMIWCIIAFLFVWKCFVKPDQNSSIVVECIWTGVVVLAALYGILNHAKCIPSKAKIIDVLDNFLFKKIMGRNRFQK